MNTYLVVAATDAGPVRKRNEDSWGVWVPGTPGLQINHGSYCGELPATGAGVVALVSDGMGGALAGDYASRSIVERLHSGFVAGDETEPARLLALLQSVHRTLIRESEENAERAGMGGTCTLLRMRESGPALLVQVGDSRLYRWRDNELMLCSEDQTVAAQLMAAGSINEEEARRSRYWHVLTQAIGGGEDRPLTPKVTEVDAAPGDWFILCSDGVTDGLTDAALSDLLRLEPPAEDAEGSVAALLAAALQASGRDNATLLLVRCP